MLLHVITCYYMSTVDRKYIEGIYNGTIDDRYSHKVGVGYHIVINPNISPAKINNDEILLKKTIILLRKGIQYFAENIEQFINQGDLHDLKSIGISGVNIVDQAYYLESGDSRKFLHVDCYLTFDQNIKLNYQMLHHFWREVLKEVSKGSNVKARYFLDNLAIIRAYTLKQGNNLFDI